jgi:hypothetical protein
MVMANEFVTVLEKVGGEAKKVLSWFASTKGKQIVSAVETGIELEVPASVGVINLVNTFGEEVFKAEMIGVAAGDTADTNSGKAAMVLSTVTPQILSFAQAQGLNAPTADKIAAFNDQLVAFFNAFTVKDANTTTANVPQTTGALASGALKAAYPTTLTGAVVAGK